LSRNPAVNEISIGSRSIAKITLQDISRAREGIDCFLSSKFFSYVDSTGLSLKFLDLKKKGLRLRMISDISLKQASLYRGFLNYFEIRHFDKIAYNILLIDDSEFVMLLNENNDKRRLLCMSDKTFVSAQQFLFKIHYGVSRYLTKRKLKNSNMIKKNLLQRMFPSHMKYAISLENLTSSIDEI